MYAVWSASNPWVVYIIPGSSESGAVPNKTVIVPPDFPLELVELDDELEELPQAASAIAEPTATTAIEAVRICFLIDPPPRGRCSRGRKSMSQPA
jgi:hypothetical protein